MGRRREVLRGRRSWGLGVWTPWKYAGGGWLDPTDPDPHISRQIYAAEGVCENSRSKRPITCKTWVGIILRCFKTTASRCTYTIFLRTCYGALQLSYYYYYYYYYYFIFIYFYFILFLFFNLGRYISEDGKINVNSKFLWTIKKSFYRSFNAIFGKKWPFSFRGSDCTPDFCEMLAGPHVWSGWNWMSGLCER